MKKYSIIANCQGGTLNTFLRTNKIFSEQYKYIPLKAIQNVTLVDLKNFYKIIKTLDLVIIQPISTNFKNNNKYSTKSFLSELNKNCIIIMFPSLYFTGYYPSVNHYSIKNLNMVVIDNNLIKIFKNTNNKLDFLKVCKKMINQNNFYSTQYINNNIMKSINELKNRENNAINNYKLDNFIKVSSFINNNYKKNILFHSLNHPSKFTYIYLSNEILKVLKINIKEYPINLDPQKNCESCILYNCVKKVINPKLIKNTFSQRELPNVNLDKFLEFHYNKFKENKDKINRLELK